jgi:hypothetical protein
MDHRKIAEAMGESFYIKDLQIYSYRVTLIPFGWEYWDVDVVTFAGSLFSVINRTRPEDGSADKIFLDWLEAHMDAWAEFWHTTKEGYGPLRKLPDSLKSSA